MALSFGQEGKRDIPGTGEGRFHAGARTVAMGMLIKKMAINLTIAIFAC